MADDSQPGVTMTTARDRLAAFVVDEATRRVLQAPDSALGGAVSDSIRALVKSEVGALSDEDAQRIATAMADHRRRRSPMRLFADIHLSAAGLVVALVSLMIAFALGFAVRALTQPVAMWTNAEPAPVSAAAETPDAASPIDVAATTVQSAPTPTQASRGNRSSTPSTARPAPASTTSSAQAAAPLPDASATGPGVTP